MDRTVTNYIDRLIYLEEALGKRASYKILEPFSWLPSSYADRYLALQTVTKRLAAFVGLGEYTFTVAVVPQGPRRAACIEATRDQHVFIEIDEDMLTYEAAVLATLAHELTHQYLHVHSIGIGLTTPENEYLTDIAAVYLGFGKLLLNGCESEVVQTVGNDRITKKKSVGYVDSLHLALVYKLTCRMRGILPHIRDAALNERALSTLRTCEFAFSPELDLNGQLTCEQWERKLRGSITEIQEEFADRERPIHFIAVFLDEVNAERKRAHALLHGIDAAAAHSLDNVVNPHLKYLKLAKTSYSVNDLYQEKIIVKRSSSLDALEPLMVALPPSAADHIIVTCPKDDTKLRVPRGRRRLLVTCPNDGYKFFVNTCRLEVNASGQAISSGKLKEFLRRIVRVFSLRSANSAKPVLPKARPEGNDANPATTVPKMSGSPTQR